MKRLILSVMVMAFAVAVQAGDAKTSQNKDTDKPACCASKVKTSADAKEGTCPFAKAACCNKQTTAKATTTKATVTKQTVLLSPKAADTAN